MAPHQNSLGELTAPPQTSWLDLRGPTSKGRGRKEGKETAGKGRREEGKEKREKRGEAKGRRGEGKRKMAENWSPFLKS